MQDIKRNETSLNNKYYGFYRGIVVQNNDPVRRGRVKIFVPQITSQYFSSTNKTGSESKDVFEARFAAASNIKTFLNECEPYILLVTPWAEKASPLIGGGSTGFRSKVDNQATTSFSNINSQRLPQQANNNLKQTKATAEQPTEIPQVVSTDLQAIEGPLPSNKENTVTNDIPLISGTVNPTVVTNGISNQDQEISNIVEDIPLSTEDDSSVTDGTGSNASRSSEILPAPGAFSGSGPAPGVDFGNASYAAKTYYDCAGGTFSVPNVGAHVWIFFENGDIQYPVYFAYNFDQEDWHGMYDITSNANGMHYPNNSENVKTDEPFILRSKTVLHHSKGGTVEVTDTDNFESVKSSHWSGSFTEMNNLKNIEHASNDKSTVVLNNKHTTVYNENHFCCNSHSFETVVGNKDTTVGDITKKDQFDGWRNTMLPVAEIISQFDTVRGTPLVLEGTAPAISSGAPKFGVNPTIKDQIFKVKSVPVISLDISPTVKGATKNLPSFMRIDLSSFFPTSYTFNLSVIELVIPRNTKSPIPIISPSTQDAVLPPNPQKQLLENVFQTQALAAAEFEKNFGAGGMEHHKVVKHKYEQVGIIVNTYKSTRVDPIGRAITSGIKIGDNALYKDTGAHPHVEMTGNDSGFPCGNYTLIIGNKWSVFTGAGGIEIQTTGNTFINGATTQISGTHELNLGSSGNVNIKAAGALTFEGKHISFEHPDQVVFNSSLGVAKNIIAGGGLYVDGNIYCQNITAPMEMHTTEETTVHGEVIDLLPIGFTYDDTTKKVLPVYSLRKNLADLLLMQTLDPTGVELQKLETQFEQVLTNIKKSQSTPINFDTLPSLTKFTTLVTTTSGGVSDTVLTYPHAHAYRGIASKLADSHDTVRREAQTLNLSDIQTHDAVQHGKQNIISGGENN